jgi:hypothetical protein
MSGREGRSDPRFRSWRRDHADAGALTIAFGRCALQCLRGSSKRRPFFHGRRRSIAAAGGGDACSSRQLVASLVAASVAEQKSASQTGVLLRFGRRSGLARAWPDFRPIQDIGDSYASRLW